MYTVYKRFLKTHNSVCSRTYSFNEMNVQYAAKALNVEAIRDTEKERAVETINMLYRISQSFCVNNEKCYYEMEKNVCMIDKDYTLDMLL